MINASVTASAPGSEPLSLTEAKDHLDIASAVTDHDTRIGDLIEAARQLWEKDTQRLTVSRTITEKLDQWPRVPPQKYRDWKAYYEPVISLDSITYYDANNASQTLATSVYDFDPFYRVLHLKVDQEWPDIEDRWDAITITYTAGQATVEEIDKQAMKLQLDIMFELRGTTKEKDACEKAYQNLVARYMRETYP